MVMEAMEAMVVMDTMERERLKLSQDMVDMVMVDMVVDMADTDAATTVVAITETVTTDVVWTTVPAMDAGGPERVDIREAGDSVPPAVPQLVLGRD